MVLTILADIDIMALAIHCINDEIAPVAMFVQQAGRHHSADDLFA